MARPPVVRPPIYRPYDREPIRLSGVWRPIVVKDDSQYRPIYEAISNFHGGYILNPTSAATQHLKRAEPLYVSIVGPEGPAALEENADTVMLMPGGSFSVPQRVSVWVNAASNGHAYTAVFGKFSHGVPPDIRPVPPGSMVNGQPWPPAGVTGLTWVMYAYLYQEYSDDDDLQEFIKVLNELQQDYVDTFNALNLPIYTQPIIKDKLADWTMEGIYGWPRPVFYTEKARLVGPLNTYWFNWGSLPGWGPNMIRMVRPQGVLVSDDDLYKRTLTWHLQKGDGKYFNTRWLKRRIMRFMTGQDGTCPPIDQTNRISITFGPHYGATIRLINRQMTVYGGTICNMFGCNGLLPGRVGKPPGQPDKPPTIVGEVPPNTILFDFERYPFMPYEKEFQEAMDAGVLEVPFQFKWNTVIG